MKTLPTILVVLLALVMSAHVPHSLTTPILHPDVQSELDALVCRGFTYRFIDNETIELTETWSGNKQAKSLREPSEAQIRSWAAARGVPILEIDPTQIDTTKYVGWYNYWAEFPLSNYYLPLVVEDTDRNGRPEIYGMFKDFTSDHATRAYEIDSIGGTTLLHDYVPRPGFAYQTLDVDRDGFTEVLFELGGTVSSFEQSSTSSIPTVLNFQHDKYENGLSPGYTGIYLGHLDADSALDFLYKGSEADSSNGRTAVYVAEFDADSNNFVRVWSREYILGSQGGVSGFSVNDFDHDGLGEFVLSNWSGQTFVTENKYDNKYELTWCDSIPFVGVYYHGTGDVDRDGKEEFLVGASMFNGNWTVVFEADSNNAYSPILMIHLFSGGTFDSPVYFTGDFNEDGALEIAIFSGADLYVFHGEDNVYSLWYYKREFGKRSLQLHDLNNDGRKDILVGKSEIDSLGQLRFFSSVYLASTLVRVGPESKLSEVRPVELLPNYPNPFNPETKIEYVLSRKERITITVFDILGRELVTLVDGEVEAGTHSVQFDGSNLSSGMYFYTMKAGEFVNTRKLLLLK